jgi:hypothetical protein
MGTEAMAKQARRLGNAAAAECNCLVLWRAKTRIGLFCLQCPQPCFRVLCNIAHHQQKLAIFANFC